MHKLDRQNFILVGLAKKEVLTVEELCDATTSSRATIRRDLANLERKGQLVRVHGGATRPPDKLGNRDFESNLERHRIKKVAIAELAATLCEAGDAIIINGGTTTWHLCESLKAKASKSFPLQILTNSLPIATTLQGLGSYQVFITGGEVYADQHIVLGDYSEANSRGFYAGKMFIGAHSIGQHGLMESDSRLIQAEKMLIEQSEKLIVLADSSKFVTKGLLQLCSLQNIDTLITDNAISEHARDMLSEAGITLLIAQSEDETP